MARRELHEGIRIKFRLLAPAARESMRIAQKFNRGIEQGELRGQIEALFGEGVDVKLEYAPMAFDDQGRFLCDNVLYMCIERVAEAGVEVADTHKVSFTIWMEVGLQEWTSALQEEVRSAFAAAALVPADKVVLSDPEVSWARRAQGAAGPGDQAAPAITLDVAVFLPSEARATSVAARINDFGPLGPLRPCSLPPPAPLPCPCLVLFRVLNREAFMAWSKRERALQTPARPTVCCVLSRARTCSKRHAGQTGGQASWRRRCRRATCPEPGCSKRLASRVRPVPA